MDKKRALKIGGIALATFVVLYVGFTYWGRRQTQQAANATANQTDASMDASTAPGNVSLGTLSNFGITTSNSPDALALNASAAFTPGNVQSWHYAMADQAIIPASSWEYDPNYHIPYSVPTLPTGFQAPTVSAQTGTYIGNAPYVTNAIRPEVA